MAYALATYSFVLPAFAFKELEYAEWEVFFLTSLPFVGRLFGSLETRRLVSKLGTVWTYRVSLAGLAGSSMISSSFTQFGEQLAIRLLVGVLFGIMTSLAVYEAMEGRSQKGGVVFSGWALGWSLAGTTYLLAGSWSATMLIGGLVILSLPLFRGENRELEVIQVTSVSSKGILVFLLSFVPSFTLSVAPYFLEINGLPWVWIIPSYAMAIPSYYLLPVLADKIGFHRTLMLTVLVVVMSGTLFFQKLFFMLMPFTFFGLGLNSLAPKIALRYGVDSRNSGVAVNTAGLGGLMYSMFPSMMGFDGLSDIMDASLASLLILSSKRVKTKVS